MAKPGITVKVNRDQTIEVDAHGYKGKCVDILKGLNQALSVIGEQKSLVHRDESKDKDGKVVAQGHQM